MAREIDIKEFPGILPKLSDPMCRRPGEYLCSGYYIETERDSELRARSDDEICPRRNEDCCSEYHCIPAYQARIAALEADLAAQDAEIARLQAEGQAAEERGARAFAEWCDKEQDRNEYFEGISWVGVTIGGEGHFAGSEALDSWLAALKEHGKDGNLQTVRSRSYL